MTLLKIQATNVFQRNYDAWEKYKILCNQGGSRSSKTISLCQLIVTKCLERQGRVITIARKTTPSLHLSVMRDFFWVLNSMNMYDEKNHNKTKNEYYLNGNLIEFVSMDIAEKKRGSKRDILWLNEATEFDYEDYFQLMIRTTEKVVVDFNPSYEYHWLFDKVLTRNDCIFIQSTYKDNPFLEDSLVKEIERLKEVDENYWKIYGLGEKGITKAIIFEKWELIDSFPDNLDEILYGSDFGYNNPSTLIKIGVKDKDNIYIEEKLYQQFLTNSDLILKFQDIIQEYGRDSVLIKADSAEPDRIEEIKRAGFWIEGAKKGKNSVKDSIDIVKRKNLFITKNSINTIKEIRSYKWKETKDGQILDEPVPFNDHAMAAIRYAVGYLEDRNDAGIEILDWDTRPNR